MGVDRGHAWVESLPLSGSKTMLSGWFLALMISWGLRTRTWDVKDHFRTEAVACTLSSHDLC